MSDTMRTDPGCTQPSDRRNFFRGAALTAAGVAAFSVLAPQEARAALPAIPATIPGTGDIQVLNYALQLEDLEADLYAQAVLRLTTGGTDPQAAATVGTITGLNVTGLDVTLIKEFAAVETAHRNFLRSKLGSQAIAPGTYDFGIQTMTRSQVLDLVLEAEVTGVQAYLGAIPYFTTQSQYIQTAAAIQGTEARHATALTVARNLLVSQGLITDKIAAVAPLKGDPGGTVTASSYDNNNPNLGTPEGRELVMTPDQVLARVGPFIKTATAQARAVKPLKK